MSWDVLITAKGAATKEASQISMGSANEVRAKISKSLPAVDWSNPDWGVLKGDGWTIEFSHQRKDVTDSLMLHVRGGGDPLPTIVKLCKENNWEAYDAAADAEINLDAPSTQSWNEFQVFRDKVSTSIGQPIGDAPLPVSHRIGYASASLLLFAVIIYLLWRK